MAISNNMTNLIKLIELRIGTKPLNLPPEIAKDKWSEWLELSTLATYSRFYANKIRYTFNRFNMKKDAEGYYLIDEDVFPGNVEIIGIKDIPWDDPNAFGNSYYGYNNTMVSPVGFYDIDYAYSYDQIASVQASADRQSLFNMGIFIDFRPPNKLKLVTASGEFCGQNMPKTFKVDLLTKHPSNLNTIEPTKLETFQNLAIADIADFLYQFLKHYDNVETVFANSSLKVEDLQTIAQKREEIVNELKEGYVSADNFNQPIMYTI